MMVKQEEMNMKEWKMMVNQEELDMKEWKMMVEQEEKQMNERKTMAVCTKNEKMKTWAGRMST